MFEKNRSRQKLQIYFIGRVYYEKADESIKKFKNKITVLI